MNQIKRESSASDNGQTESEFMPYDDDDKKLAEVVTEAMSVIESIPVVLAQLDDDGREFFINIMQGCLETGYSRGFKDAKGNQ